MSVEISNQQGIAENVDRSAREPSIHDLVDTDSTRLSLQTKTPTYQGVVK